MSSETNPAAELPPQSTRDQFAAAIEAGDSATVRQMLQQKPALANTDLRPPERRDQFTRGLPLHRACERGHEELAELLLDHGAHPDCPGSNPDDQPEFGIPLHAAVDQRNYRLASLLLDRGASPNGYPNCDKSTMERIFYQAREAGVSDAIIRRSYAKYLPDREQLESVTAQELLDADPAEPIVILARMLDAGGQPPFCALVREGLHELVMELVEHSVDADGTPHDHPNSTVLDNVSGAARWYGYPRLVRRLMDRFPQRVDYESAIGTIGVAIGSHNRDGGYAEYREIIVMQLDALKSLGHLPEAREDPDFKPIYQIATDFCWHANYGYKADIVKPECYIDLAELFVSWGFNDVSYVDPKSNHSPLTAAIGRGKHPGIHVFIQWLVERGADLRESETDNRNPLAMARERGFDGIVRLLEDALQSP